MTPASRFFISCVSVEFRTYRARLREALTSSSHELKIQEDFQDGPGTLMQKLDHYITRCQAVIHLVGSSTGVLAKPAEIRWLLETYPDFVEVLPELRPWLDPNNCPFSYTQWECFLALYHRVACFIYRAGAGSEREPGWEEEPGAVAGQEEHLQRLYSLGQDRRITDFADARDIALRFLNSYYSDGGQAPAHATGDITWPNLDTSIPYMLADREHEFGRFCSLLCGDSVERVLAIHGPSDRGKSALMVEFLRFTQRQEGMLVGYAEFKGNLPLAAVLQDLRRDLKGVRFPRFERYREGGPAEMLRNAFLLDLEECRSPVVLILDAFEQATDEAKQWVQDRLLPLCDSTAGIRIVLSGKSIPDLRANHRLAPRVQCLELAPINDPTPWCDYGRRVLGLCSARLPDDHIRTLVVAAQGSPRAVSTLLSNLKASPGPA